MDVDTELPCDLSVLHCEESDALEYVVIRGYNPGCTTKWDHVSAFNNRISRLTVQQVGSNYGDPRTGKCVCREDEW